MDTKESELSLVSKQFQQLNIKAQRISHRMMMMAARLPIATATLETIATGNHDQGVLKIAREALAKLDSDKPEVPSFSGPDAPTPAVDVEDLKRYRELLENLPELDVSSDSDEWPKGSIARYSLQKVVEKVCPDANAAALSHRNGTLEMLLREGYLAPLQTCMELDDAVLRAIATIPFSHQLKPEVFVQRLREEGINVAENVDRRQFKSSGDEADHLRRLRHHCRLMNEDALQLEHRNELLKRRMATARTALETLRNVENPEVSKLASETLDKFEVLSDGEKFMAFTLADTGSPVPTVDPGDLSNVWNLSRGFSASPGKQVAVGAEMYRRVCRPGTDTHAVWYRSSLLAMMARGKLLDPWMHDGTPNEAVFSVMASFSVKTMGPGVHQGLPLDVEEFLKQIGNAVNPGIT